MCARVHVCVCASTNIIQSIRFHFASVGKNRHSLLTEGCPVVVAQTYRALAAQARSIEFDFLGDCQLFSFLPHNMNCIFSLSSLSVAT